MKKYFCLHCNDEVETKTVLKDESFQVKDTIITCLSEIRVCCKCGEEIYDKELDDKTLLKFYAGYRLQKNLLSPEKIKLIREKYAATQAAFAKILGLGEKTITRYENGAIQEKSIDNLIRLVEKTSNFKDLYNKTCGSLNEKEKRDIDKKIRELEQEGVIGFNFKSVGKTEYTVANYYATEEKTQLRIS